MGVAIAIGATRFDWGDAAVGAAASVGALLVLIGGSLIVLRRRLRGSGPATNRTTKEDE